MNIIESLISDSELVFKRILQKAQIEADDWLDDGEAPHELNIEITYTSGVPSNPFMAKVCDLTVGGDVSVGFGNTLLESIHSLLCSVERHSV